MLGSMGRKKIDIKLLPRKKIKGTYAKRRNGLLNKAKEMGLLCGNQVVLIAFNPNGSEVEAVATNGNIMDILTRFVDFKRRNIGQVHSVQVSSTGTPSDHPLAPPDSIVSQLQPTCSESDAQVLHPTVQSMASTSDAHIMDPGNQPNAQFASDGSYYYEYGALEGAQLGLQPRKGQFAAHRAQIGWDGCSDFQGHLSELQPAMGLPAAQSAQPGWDGRSHIQGQVTIMQSAMRHVAAGHEYTDRFLD